MAVVVRTPDVDDLVEAPLLELVAVVGDVGGKIGVEPVGPAEHVVFQVQLGDVLLALPLLPGVLLQNPAGGQPQGPLLLVGVPGSGELVHRLRHISGAVQLGLKEPLVVLDLIPAQVGLHLGDVPLQTEFRQRSVALLFGNILQAVPVFVIVRLGQLPDVVAVVAVLGERHRVLPQNNLEIPRLQGVCELFNLVPRIVDIELPPDLGPVGLQHGGQGVPQHAPPGVAHVHGPGRVGGDELHHDLLALQRLVAPVSLPLALHGGEDTGVPRGTQPEVEEPRPGNFRRGEIAAGEVQILQQNLRNLPGPHLHRLGRGQGEGGGIVPVGGVLGDLHPGPHGHVPGELPGGDCRRTGFLCQRQDLVLGVLNHVDHWYIILPLKYATRPGHSK